MVFFNGIHCYFVVFGNLVGNCAGKFFGVEVGKMLLRLSACVFEG